MKVIGIEIGTTSVSGTVIDAVFGEQLAIRTVPNNTKIAGQPWSSEQDAERIYRICQTMVEEYK